MEFDLLTALNALNEAGGGGVSMTIKRAGDRVSININHGRHTTVLLVPDEDLDPEYEKLMNDRFNEALSVLRDNREV